MKQVSRRCNSLRTKTVAAAITTFVLALAGLLLGLLVGVASILTSAERDVSVSGLRRVMTEIAADLSLQDMIADDYALWDLTGTLVDALAAGENSTVVEDLLEQVFTFGNNWSATSIRQNLIALYGTDGGHLWSEYHPPTASFAVGWEAAPAVPRLFAGEGGAPPELVRAMKPAWSGLVTPPGGFPTMMVSFHEVRLGSSETFELKGYMAWASVLSAHSREISDAAPACLTMWQVPHVDGNSSTSSPSPSQLLPRDAADALGRLVPVMMPVTRETSKFGQTTSSPPPPSSSSGAVTVDQIDWGEHALVEAMDRSDLTSSPGRTCPKDNGKPETSEVSATYVVFTDGFEGHPLGPIMRIDNSRDLAHRGGRVLNGTAIGTALVLMFLCACFVVFLEIVVLRRLDRLRLFVTRITSSVPKHPPSESDETTQPCSRRSSFDRSDSGVEGDLGSGDEIGRVGQLAERHVENLRRNFEKTSAELERQHKIGQRYHDALKVLNLWRGRDSQFMGLSVSFATLSAASRVVQGKLAAPAAASSSPPTAAAAEPASAKPVDRKFEEILMNPIALEFFKESCSAQGCLASLFFVLDVAFLNSLERTSPGCRTARAMAQMIHANYLTKKSATLPQLSQGVRKKLGRKKLGRKKAATYSRGMFDPAAAEMRKLIVNEIVPKFRSGTESEVVRMAVEIFDDTAVGGADPDEPKALKKMIKKKTFLQSAVGRLREIGESMISAGPGELDVEKQIEGPESGSGVSLSSSSSSSSGSSLSSPLESKAPTKSEIEVLHEKKSKSRSPTPTASPTRSRNPSTTAIQMEQIGATEEKH